MVDGPRRLPRISEARRWLARRRSVPFFPQAIAILSPFSRVSINRIHLLSPHFQVEYTALILFHLEILIPSCIRYRPPRLSLAYPPSKRVFASPFLSPPPGEAEVTEIRIPSRRFSAGCCPDPYAILVLVLCLSYVRDLRGEHYSMQ